MLNLHGVLSLVTGSALPMTLAMLLAASVVIARQGGAALKLSLVTLVFTIAAYLIFGTFYYVPPIEQDDISQYWLTYLGTIALVWAIASQFARDQGIGPISVATTRNLSVLGALLVLATPLLVGVYKEPPISYSDGRWGGVFANPNEAGIVGVYALVLTAHCKFKSKILGVLVRIGLYIAIGMTFSKTAIALAIVIEAVIALRAHAIYATGVGVIVFALSAYAGAWGPGQAPVGASDFFFATRSQAERADALLRMATIRVDRDVTTGRYSLWNHGVDVIVDDIPHGHGLGSFHHFEGLVCENGVWQGVHNSVLMITGEAGLLVGAMFVGWLLYTCAICWRKKPVGMEFLLMLVFLVEVASTHTALAHRYSNVVLGLVIGSLSASGGIALRKKPNV